jgi:tryptophan synthase alpha chain
VSGLIVPDLPLEEAADTLTACDARGLALVPLVAPTTPEPRLAAIGARARGFVYAVSLTGTTGERAQLDAALNAVVARASSHTDVPVAVGFGISTPEQAAAAAAAGADGVIVGTRLVRAAGEEPDAAAAVARLVGQFSAALR